MEKHKAFLKVLELAGLFVLCFISNGIIALPPTDRFIKFNSQFQHSISLPNLNQQLDNTQSLT
jgi:hypothetical protein